MDQHPVPIMSALPEVEIPSPLPTVPVGQILLPVYTIWHEDPTREYLLGLIVTEAYRQQQRWCPVRLRSLTDLMNLRPFAWSVQMNVIPTLRGLAGSEFLDVVKVGDWIFVIPKPRLADILSSGKYKFL